MRMLLQSLHSFLAISFVVGILLTTHVSTAQTPLQYPDHQIWNQLLQRHVDANGFLNYKGMRADSLEFNTYLSQLSAAKPKAKHWSRAEKMAFWINAYNAFTVKLILDHYPVASIKDIKRGIPMVNSVWDIKFIQIDNKTYDLNHIEHKILRAEFKDARIHAAINCASFSCPLIRNEAFFALSLEDQLNDAMTQFMNDPQRNLVTAQKAEISEIFKWFRSDFVRDAGSLRAYLNRFATQKLQANGIINYLPYQWTLNDVE